LIEKFQRSLGKIAEGQILRALSYFKCNGIGDVTGNLISFTSPSDLTILKSTNRLADVNNNVIIPDFQAAIAGIRTFGIGKWAGASKIAAQGFLAKSIICTEGIFPEAYQQHLEACCKLVLPAGRG